MSMSVLDGLIQKGLVSPSMDQVNREAYADQWSEEVPETVDSLRELTVEQKRATDEICEDLHSGKFCARLLQGVTGSGKTEVYCQAMETALEQGEEFCFLFLRLPWLLKRWTDCGQGLANGGEGGRLA